MLTIDPWKAKNGGQLILILINGVPCVQIELKTLGISPRRAMEQIVDYKNDAGNGYVLRQIGIADPNRVADIVNALSHKKVYYFESDIVVSDNLNIFDEVMDGLIAKYNFVLHAE